MKKIKMSICMLLVLVFLLSAVGCTSSNSSQSSAIRIGWQTTWATQGQIVQTLVHTNALAKNGLNPTFVGVTYGAPLNEAALAGEVDVIFTADQPAATLIAKSDDWVIVGRLMFNRVGLYVPPESPIQTIADLRGKTIAMPFGAAAQREALKVVADAGLNPETDITSVNLDITEQAGVIANGTASSWGDIDAMAGFDPTVAAFEISGQARMLHIGTVTSVIVMSKTYINSHPGAPVQFLSAFIEAVYYYSGHQNQANEWFRNASQLTFSNEVLALAASVEPNLQARSVTDISITFTPELISGMQEAADFIYSQGLIKQPVIMKAHIDQSYAQAAQQTFSDTEYDSNNVVVTGGK